MPTEKQRVYKPMSPTAASTVHLLAESGGRHQSLNPVFIGGSAFVILLVMLLITTRFNKDR